MDQSTQKIGALAHACALPRSWRDRASELRKVADAEGAARAFEHAAGELENWLRAQDQEELTLQEAADRVGRSWDTVQKAVSSGRLPNVGRKHAPRVRAGDVDRVFGRTAIVAAPRSGYDVAADARALLGRRGD